MSVDEAYKLNVLCNNMSKKYNCLIAYTQLDKEHIILTMRINKELYLALRVRYKFEIKYEALKKQIEPHIKLIIGGK